MSENDSHPTPKRHPAPSGSGPHHKSTLAEPINYRGRRIAILEQREIGQKAQIPVSQIALQPGARQWSPRHFRPHLAWRAMIKSVP